jgi:hypothetical protein
MDTKLSGRLGASRVKYPRPIGPALPSVPVSVAAICAALAAMLCAGCASESRRADRPEREEPWHSTIATDPSTVPAGQTIPPAGIGVDL